MEPLEIGENLKKTYPDEVLEIFQFRDQVSVTVNRDRILDICRYLKKDTSLAMNFLSDLCGVDYKGRELRFEVVYNLYSMTHNHRIRIKALIPESDPSIESVVPVWSGANCHERETYDMFGIVFRGHPDLRRILLPEDWEGFPLRKEYPLKGPEGWEYRGYKEAKELHTHDGDWKVT
jgi:NADH-quinone oxidoreductase subunit C